jgi:hypothetical protein
MSTTTPAAAQVGVAAPPKLEKKPVKFSNLLRMSTSLSATSARNVLTRLCSGRWPEPLRGHNLGSAPGSRKDDHGC